MSEQETYEPTGSALINKYNVLIWLQCPDCKKLIYFVASRRKKDIICKCKRCNTDDFEIENPHYKDLPDTRKHNHTKELAHGKSMSQQT